MHIPSLAHRPLPAARPPESAARYNTPEIGELILRLKAEKPQRRSVRRIIRALERGRKVARGELKKSTALRFLKRHGMSGRPRRVCQKSPSSFVEVADATEAERTALTFWFSLRYNDHPDFHVTTEETE